MEILEHHTGDSDPFSRPKLKDVNLSKIDGIIFFSMERFTRQHPIKVIHMINRLKDRGIKIISITEPAFNMESEFSEIILYIFTWFNNYFLKKLKIDIKSGLANAVAKGVKLGRPKVDANIYEIKRLKNDGKSLREIAKELNLSLGKVQRCIKNTPLKK